MSYKIEMSNYPWESVKTKDEVIQSLMGYINGDGVVQIKITYPDGSFWEMTGE